MNQGRIIVITGSPGTGKTTTASIVAKESDMDKSVHICHLRFPPYSPFSMSNNFSSQSAVMDGD